MNKSNVLTAITLLLLLGCDNSTTTTNNVSTPDLEQETTNPIEKSKEEKIFDGALQVTKALTPLVEKGIQNKRYKDSMLIANKEEIWAYQIGVPFNDINALSEELEKLRSIEGISVFENKGDYSIIKNGDSEQQLLDSLGNFKSQIKKLGTQITKIDVVNLSSKCIKRDHIKESKERKLKRKFPKIHCYECD